MQLTGLKGYPDFVGKRATFVGFGSGPASYSATTGDVVTLPMPNWYIDALDCGGTLSVSGNFFVRAWSSTGTGARQSWSLRWFNTSNSTEVSNSTNLSAEKVQIGAFVGQY